MKIHKEMTGIEIFGICIGLYYFSGFCFVIYEMIREEWFCPNPFLRLRNKYFPIPEEEKSADNLELSEIDIDELDLEDIVEI